MKILKTNLKEVKRGWILLFSILAEVVVFTAICVFPWFLSISIVWRTLITAGGVVVTIVLDFCLIYFWWARRNLYFTFVPEGRAKIVVRGDAFHKIIIQWKGHKLSKQQQKDAKGDVIVDINDVIREETSFRQTLFERILRIFGGLRCYGFWPIEDIYLYDFEWVGMKQNGELDPHPKETLDHVLLKDDVYGVLVEQAEDKGLLPLNIRLALTMKIVNPYKALFRVQNWYEMVINRITPYVRDFVTTNTYQEFIQGETRIDKGVMERLIGEGILDEFKNRYGVKLRKIEVKDIDPSKDLDNPIRKATIQKYLAAREGEKRAGETIGAVINMMAASRGITPKEIQKKIDKSTVLQKEFRDFCKETLHKKMAIDGGSYVKIDVSGVGGVEKTLADLAAIWLRMPMGKRKEKGEKPEEEENKEEKKEEELENVQDFWREKRPMEQIHQRYPKKRAPKRRRR